MTYVVGAPRVLAPTPATPPTLVQREARNRPRYSNLVTSLVVTSPAGSVDLMARPWRVMVGSRGLTTVTRRPDLVSLPGRDGVVRRRASGTRLYSEAREIEIPLFLGHHADVASPEQLSAEVQRLQDILDEDVFRDGEVTLTVSRADGTTRWIRVVHTPVAGDMDPVAWWQTSWMPTLRLLAPDPWARSKADPITWGLPAAAGPFLPFFPMRIGTSTVVGAANPVSVLGDKQAWPTLTVSGPATSVTASRGDGVSWTLTPPAPLLAGQTITVRHDPSVGVADDLETVEGPAGQPWYRYLEPGSVLWGLRPGEEQVEVTVPGSTAQTTATITWDHRYRSLL